MLTYKNIARIVRTFAINHSQIRENHRGNIVDVDEIQKVDGAYLIWQIGSIVPALGNVGSTWSLNMYFVSQITEINNPSNQETVMNESVLQAQDFISFINKLHVLEDDVFDLTFNKQWSIEPFEERFNSLYAGAWLQISFDGSYSYNICDIPFTQEGINFWEIEDDFIVQ